MTTPHTRGPQHPWPYDEHRALGPSRTRRQETSDANARADHKPGDENEEGLRP